MASGELFDLSASISIDTSGFDKGINDAKSALGGLSDGVKSVDTGALSLGLSGAESAATRLVDVIGDDLVSSLQEGAEGAENLGDAVGEELPAQVEKASDSVSVFGEILKADFVKGAINTAIEAVQSLGSAIVGLASNSVSDYADYEQLVGGIETIFGDSKDKIIGYADEAWKTAGMSANQYLDSVMAISTALISGLKEQAVALSDEEVAARESALDDMLSAEKTSLTAEYKAAQKAYTNEYNAYKKTLDKEYDARKDQLDSVYDALSESLDKEIEAYQEASEKRLEEAESAYNANVDAYKKATDARIAEIDREYLESVKLIDEERYARLKAIEDQIDALNAQTDAEQKAYTKRERAEKIASLQSAITNANSIDEQQKAIAELQKYKAEVALKERQEARKEQIAALNEEKDAINEEADAKKDAAKDQRDAQVEAVNDEKEATLAAMKEQYEAEKKALEDAQSEELEVLQKAKATQLNALKSSQADELSSLKEAQSEQLSAMKEGNDDKLSALKEANSNRLKELEKQVKAEKALLTSSFDTTGLSQEELAAIYDEAAEIANRSMTDMSDIANKMGVNLESVMSGVIGMSRNNYTMLDNLRLGFAGTAEGAQAMLDMAENIKASQGEAVEYTLGNMADMLNALHVVLENMDIVKTTENEAEGTISGAYNALMAAAQDFVIGLGREDADIITLTDNLTNSFETYWANLEPALIRIFDSLGESLSMLIPKIKAWADENLPTIIGDLKQFLSDIWDGISPGLPDLAGTVISDIQEALKEQFPVALPLLEVAFGGWIASGIIKGIGGIGKQITPAVEGLAGSIGSILTGAIAAADAALIAYDVSKINEAISTYDEAQKAHESESEQALENYRMLYETKGKEIADQWAAAVYGIDTTNDDFYEAQKALFEKVESYWNDVPQSLWQGFEQGWDYYFNGSGGGLVGLVSDGFSGMVDGAKDFLGIHSPSTVFEDIGENTLEGFEEGWKDQYKTSIDLVKNGALHLVDVFMDALVMNEGEPSMVFKDIGANVLDGFLEGWNGRITGVIDTVKSGATDIADAFKVALDIHSPSGIFRGFGEMTPLGYAEGVRSRLPDVRQAIDEMGEAAISGFDLGSQGLAPQPMWGPTYQPVGTQEAPREQTVILTLNQYELGRVVYQLYNEEMQRHGVNVVSRW